ncbi:MAG TPA: hypothetical protein VIL74_21340 [Pyrinomonadaceae bacterium]|jgi:hypothetical protein
MSKKSKEIVSYVVAGAAIVILPILLLNYFAERRREMFHRHVSEDHKVCRERSEKDSRDAVWCDEIRKTASLAFSEAESAGNLSPVLLIVQPFLFMLFISIYNLRKQLDELKKNINA